MELWRGWSNIHYIMPWLPLGITRIEQGETAEQGQPITPAETQAIATGLGYKQTEMELV